MSIYLFILIWPKTHRYSRTCINTFDFGLYMSAHETLSAGNRRSQTPAHQPPAHPTRSQGLRGLCPRELAAILGATQLCTAGRACVRPLGLACEQPVKFRHVGNGQAPDVRETMLRSRRLRRRRLGRSRTCTPAPALCGFGRWWFDVAVQPLAELQARVLKKPPLETKLYTFYVHNLPQCIA